MNGVIELTGRERTTMELLLNTVRVDPRQYKRALALLLLDEGSSTQEVAEHLHVSRQTIYNWANRLEDRQDLDLTARLADAPRSGRPPIALGIIDPFIEAVIEQDPRDYGYNSTVWTAELLGRYLWERHRLSASLRSIGRVMVRLRVRWKHPRHELARRDPFWRQAKGGLKRAFGRIRARSSWRWMKPSLPKLRRSMAATAALASRCACPFPGTEPNEFSTVSSTFALETCSC